MCTMEIRTLDLWVRSQCSTTKPTWQVKIILLSYLPYPNKKLGRYFVALLPGVRRECSCTRPASRRCQLWMGMLLNPPKNQNSGLTAECMCTHQTGR